MNTERAIFAAGCFWGVQAYFDRVDGVTKTTVGYTGGSEENPTYEQVCQHSTGHAEAVEVEFDPRVTSYQVLLKHFFKMHDPTQVGGQGPDIGDNYRSAIFYLNEEQKEAAEKLKADIKDNFDKPIATEITKASEFYPAEEYHQKYFDKTGMGACHIWPDQVSL